MELICRCCNHKMKKVDSYTDFASNVDEYYVCEECGATAIAKIRYDKLSSIAWTDINGVHSCERIGKYKERIRCL